MNEKTVQLEDRLVEFAVQMINLGEMLPKSRAANYLTDQVTRSGTAPALIYGEAQAAESPADFLHKMRIGLKELRETLIAQKIIRRKNWLPESVQTKSIDENNQLISIFVSSIKTAIRNNPPKSPKS